MKKEDLDKVLYELKSFLSEEDYEELMRRGQAILLDEKEGRNGFIEKPRIERVFLRVFSPLVFVHIVISVGLHHVEIPILCFNIYELER